MSCSDVKVFCPSFKWWTFVLLFLPLIFCTIFQTLFIGVWKFNFETKLRQEVRRFCFNVLRAFALKMRKLPKLFDVGCFLNCLFAIVDGVFAIIIKPWYTRLFWICRGLWYSLISYWYYCFVKLQNWICGISDRFRLKFSPAHLFVQVPVSFVKFVSCRSFPHSRI